MSGKVAVLVSLAALAATSAGAEQAEWAIRDVTAIVEPNTEEGRVLFRADLAVEAPSIAVRRALVRVPLGEVEVSRDMTLRVHPVTAAWARGAVSWTAGWSRPGGDFEDLVYGRGEVAAGQRGELILDVTVAVKEILEYGVPNRGFILTIDPAQGLGLPADDLTRLGTLSGVTLEVEYRLSPPLPRELRS